MAEEALAAAQQAVNTLGQSGAAPSSQPAAFEPQALKKVDLAGAAKGIDLLSDVNLNVKIELGRTRMLVEDVLKLSEGAVVELDKLAGDPVDVYVNDRHIARGEVLVLNDNFCVRINEIIQQVGDVDQPGRAAG
jgi:flagellar motor switch protein FliN/FliY